MPKVKIDKLQLWDKNPRTIKDKRFKALCKSLTDDPSFMELRPILATKEGRIYAGNMRYRAAKELGWTEVPAILTDIDDKLANERAIKDNNEFGEWNNDELSTLLDEMEKNGTDISTLGLDESIEKIIEQLNEAEIVEDEVPEPKKDPQTKLGDLWILGNHRLLCGDATKIEDVERLMNGEKADMVFTDPPYGMNLDVSNSNNLGGKDGWKNKAKNYTPVIGDNEDYDPQFLMGYFHNVAEQFWWGADYYAQRIPEKDSGSWLVWDKRAGVEDMKLTFSEFELCWSKTRHLREIVRITWSGILGTEQEFDHKRHHPTQKPIKLSSWFLDKYSKEGNIIVDCFGGSGSTLIACEQLKRKCRMLELDPKYCDVILERWMNLTKQTAYLIGDAENAQLKEPVPFVVKPSMR